MRRNRILILALIINLMIVTSCTDTEVVDESKYDLDIAEVEVILLDSWGNFDNIYDYARDNSYVISIEDFHSRMLHVDSIVLGEFMMYIAEEDGSNYILKKNVYIPTIRNVDVSIEEFEIVDSLEFEGQKELKIIESGFIREPDVGAFRRVSYYSLDVNGEWALIHYTGISFIGGL